ncbi:histone deacetylase [Tumidithrix elongata RA019]|uniref:Histone deacetylase n=1 Tax=Tumidithrix elongata BACA0141 TaxID=2716417 RepID=A0AAW9Q8I5_9CYAN|nr:histone deacetylase [Tumidithrix elongata RA019]
MPLSTFPIIYSDQFLEHQTGVYHPENSGRLTAIIEALKTSELSNRLTWKQPTPIQQRDRLRQEIERFHTPAYIDAVQAISERGGGHIDGDTIASSRTYEVALLAVSAWLDGVDLVLASNEPAFVVARPPGHHARAHTGMGFCIFSNAAIAALYALDFPNIQRVAILDWDVHHGNGTQEAVWDRPNLAYVSTHQAPFYPYTGDLEETGAHGNVLNLPMRANCSLQEYLVVFEQRVIPFLQDFKPDLLIVSAGFDANSSDPLASMSLKPQDYGVFTKLCLQLTRKIVFGLEGGYEYTSLAESVLAVVGTCLASD